MVTLLAPSIKEVECVIEVEEKVTWMTPIKEYLSKWALLKGTNEAQKLLGKVLRYVMQDEILYQMGFQFPYLDVWKKKKQKKS